jgi:hypothetical protein
MIHIVNGLFQINLTVNEMTAVIMVTSILIVTALYGVTK